MKKNKLSEQLYSGSIFGPNEYLHQRSYPTSVTHNFYLYGAIDEFTPSVVDMITTLDLATDQDIINIFVNTPGGALNVTISIIHAMMRSNAVVITHADGDVASAGTLIFFAGHLHVVYPYSKFMFHDSSGGIDPYAKSNENFKMIQAGSELLRNMVYDLYCPVFTEEEVDTIMSGIDYYCLSDEMLQRLKAAFSDEEEEVEEIVDPKPKKTRKKKTD